MTYDITMRILLLNLYYPPDTGATARIIQDVAQALSERHELTVVAGRPSYQPQERHPYYLFRRERDENVNVERVGSTAFHRRRMAARVTNFITYLTLAFLRAITARPRPDVIIAMTDPPLVCLPAAVAAMVRRCRFVYNVRDLHPDMAVASGAVRPGLFVSLWERLHRWALKRADLVIVLGEDMRERILAKGVSPKRAVVVRDGATPLVPPATRDHAVTREIRDGHELVVVHAGNLGFAGVWDTLLEAARRLEHEGVGLVFIGDGALKPSLEKKAKGIGNVRFLPYYPPEDLPQVLVSADLHVVTLGRGLEGLVVPSKLYPILMAGRPVLAVTPPESDVARIVREYGCGLVANPDDPHDVVASIRRVLSYSEVLDEMGRQAGVAAQAFGRAQELRRFERLIQEVAGHQPKND